MEGTKPPVWRRLVVLSDTLLPKPHTILQTAMGWSDYHLHAFEQGRLSYGVPSQNFFDSTISERKIRLEQLLRVPKDWLRYVYDFRDDWRHKVVLEKVLPVEGKPRRAVCVAGVRACPPEDVGGPWGYKNFLEAIADPNHPEHATFVEWWDDDFDTDALDLEAVKRELARLR